MSLSTTGSPSANASLATSECTSLFRQGSTTDGNTTIPDVSRGLSPHVSYRTFASGIDVTQNGSQKGKRISLVLENSGSVARDHLALERTFLAYVRTSLTIASAGVALAQLFTLSSRLDDERFLALKPFEVYAKPLATSSIILALYILFVGVWRYFSTQAGLTAGVFPVTRVRLAIVALGLGGLIAVLFGLLLMEQSDPS
ncbi:hypothetical protein DFH06DRAFT_603214 [Mycena polygramma]|nr:hypothetical protein DFH06DRAFT_603214 [Mycena polygramma]